MLDEVELDKKPKSEENPVAFMEAVSEKQKPKEDSMVVFYEVKDETLMPPDDPAYSREGHTGPPSSCRECDDEFAETTKPEVYLLCYYEHHSKLLSECSMLNNLSRAFCSKMSITEKLVVETIADKPEPQNDSMYAEEPLPENSPNDDDETVLEAPTMEKVIETVKPTLTSIEQTGMPIEETEVPTEDRNYGLDRKSMLDEVEFDKKPKSEETPVAFMETVSEKQKPKEDSTVVIFEMKDETLMPLDDPAYSREGLTGPPFSCRECEDEFAETSKPEVYLLCYCKQLYNCQTCFPTVRC
jgi:hypothetical protein